MQPIQTRRNKIENSNVGMIFNQNVMSQDAKNDCGMQIENYDSISDRLEKLESSLKYVIRKVDQLDKRC